MAAKRRTTLRGRVMAVTRQRITKTLNLQQRATVVVQRTIKKNADDCTATFEASRASSGNAEARMNGSTGSAPVPAGDIGGPPNDGSISKKAGGDGEEVGEQQDDEGGCGENILTSFYVAFLKWLSNKLCSFAPALPSSATFVYSISLRSHFEW